VDSILTYDGKLKRANAMDAVVLTIDRHLDISRGDMLVKKADMPFIANEFEAIVCWMSNEPLLKDRAYFLKHTTKNVRCFIKDIHYRINIDDLRIEDASELRLNQIGKVHIISHEPLILDTYDRNRTTGSCIIINEFSCDTVGAVMVLDRAGITELERKVGLLT
jgi:sulfate adenylyltransferase subunit 1 (EFTu-like GTPase family)